MRRATVVLCAALALTVAIPALAHAQKVNDSDSDVLKRPSTRLEVLTRILNHAPQVVQAMNPAQLRNMLNAVARAARTDGPVPQAISCGIVDGDVGSPDGTIDAWNQGDTADWLNYSSGGSAANKVSFILIPLFQGSPLQIVIQAFALSPASSTNIVTPAGVPFWGGDATLGRWLLITLNDAGDTPAYCVTDVTP